MVLSVWHNKRQSHRGKWYSQKVWSKFIKPFSSYVQLRHVAPPTGRNARRRATVQDTMVEQIYELRGFIALVRIPNMSFLTQIVSELWSKPVLARGAAHRRAAPRNRFKNPKRIIYTIWAYIISKPHVIPSNGSWVMLHSAILLRTKKTNGKTFTNLPPSKPLVSILYFTKVASLRSDSCGSVKNRAKIRQSVHELCVATT